MKVFYSTSFDGFYQVGTAAIIVAKNIDEAVTMLAIGLGEIGLTQPVGPQHLVEIKTSKESVHILCDGDY